MVVTENIRKALELVGEYQALQEKKELTKEDKKRLIKLKHFFGFHIKFPDYEKRDGT